jgi:hypothetical protein
MHRCGNAGDLVDKQDRRAVSDQNRQRKVRRGRHEAVHLRGLSLPRPVHDSNVTTMTLAHEQQMISWNVKGA